MFKSFFPNPKWFFISFVVWSIATIILWHGFHEDIGAFLGLDVSKSDAIIGLGFFATQKFLLFYGYFALCTALFAAFWFTVAPHKWQKWSVLGSAFILFSTFFSVQVSVALNHWRRPFGDMLQQALNGDQSVSADGFYSLLLIFAQIAFLAIAVFVVTKFFVSHYVFRWRTAMNDYYTASWPKIRTVEGSSQRVQEDTMRFATTVEGLGVSLLDAVMTLIAFLPILVELSQYVEFLPIVGSIPYPLVFAAIAWSLFGTTLLAVVGIKLPGLEFKNQRVEAAYRKELVYGEDNQDRAQPESLVALFSNLRRNYFRLYFHYMYFNVARMFYLQADNIFAILILVPTIFAGTITYGIFTRITTAFSQVSSSFQYLVNSWTIIVELLSVYKRLASFEKAINDQAFEENYALD